ncbi:MAG: hypothetical protein MUC68_15490 [Burkholderiaceae bacterium]|jgi:hypothetical protein|nr:hypothetical protein [Burkholderiaceae bacterium]
MKPDRMRYLSEMTAAGAAVAVFCSVYLVAYTQFGWLATLLVAWLPAAVLAWLAARLLRSAAQTVFHFNPDSLARMLADDALEPVAIQRRSTRPRRRD